MNQQDKLRNTLREYYDNKEVPYDDNEWERASAYLGAARRRRRVRGAALMLTAASSVLFIVLSDLSGLTGNDKHQASSLSGQKSNPIVVGSAPAPKSPALPAQTIQPKTKVAAPSDPIVAPEQHVSAVASAPEIPETDPEAQAGKTSGIFESDITEQGSDPLQENSVAIKQDRVTAPLSLVNTTGEDNQEQDAVKDEAKEDPEELAETLLPAAGDPAHHQDRSRPEEQVPAPADTAPQLAAPALNDQTKETAIAEKTNFAGPEEKTPAALADTSRYTVFADTAAVTDPVFADTLPASFNLAGEGIFYEAGAAWYYGWKGPEKRDARGFSPLAGISYMNRLGNRYSFSFGIRYLQVPELSNSSKTSRISTYKYGEQSRVTVITPSTLHYLVVPLQFHYYPDHHNSFGAGLNLAYLLNVDAAVTSYDEMPGRNDNYETVKLSGYTEGFSWFDSQLAVFYRRRIGKRLGLQAEIFMGLTDVKQDRFFGFNGKEKNSGAKLSLIYYAFRKNGK